MHGCVESIRSGVTTLVDFMYVHTRPGMIQAVVEAFEETGIRGFVCRGFVSFGEEYGVPRELIERAADTPLAMRASRCAATTSLADGCRWACAEHDLGHG